MLDSLTRPETKTALSNILDCFSGADASFYKLMLLCIELDKKAADGDIAAIQVLDCVIKLDRLIDIANK